MKHVFSEFKLTREILKAVDDAGFVQPTRVQTEVIPVILEGKDVLARAETGSGKTAAYVLPLIEKLLHEQSTLKNRNTNHVSMIVLVPTRELTIQIREEFERFSASFSNQTCDIEHPVNYYKKHAKPAVKNSVDPKPIKCLSVYGGVKINPQMMALRGGADVLVSTPGRLLDLEKNNAIHLHQVKTLVVDEVDRLMKGDFQEEIETILKHMPRKRQNLMFTATFPESIRKLVRQFMHHPVIINVDETLYKNHTRSTTDNVSSRNKTNLPDSAIRQQVMTVNQNNKTNLLSHLLKTHDWQQVLIFCSAKRSCDYLVKKLSKRGIEAYAMHGNQQQNVRAAALKKFKSKEIRILIATDVASRGIDIEQLPCVINFELPRSPNDYIHRIGRTGRAGESGIAISLIAHHEFQHFGVIEKRNGIRLQRQQIAGFEADKEAPAQAGKLTSKKKTRKKASKKASKKIRKRTGSKQKRPVSAKTDKGCEFQAHKTEHLINAHIWEKKT